MAEEDKDNSAGVSFKKMCILSLCNKWQSWGESIPVINRELCLALARAGHRVVCLVLTSSELDKEEARKGNVELIQCTKKPGINNDDPQLFYHEQLTEFLPNLVIGHGRLTGPAALQYASASSCPRLHVIHDHPKQCVKYDETVNDKCNEEELAMSADFTAAVGTLLKEEWSALINRDDVIEIIPGLPDLTTRNSISTPQCRCFVAAKFRSPIASGLRTALIAVNNASKRELRPRRTTIIVRNTDSNTMETPLEILKECDKRCVDLVERAGNNCQEAYFDIQGATVFLSPARIEPFGVAALDAIAIGIPIVISAHSGLAFTICKHFDEQFHCSMKERGDDDDIDEDDDADIWAMEIDKVAVKTAESFASADKLRSEWKKKFTWDMVAEQLTTIIVNSGKISSSPADQLNTVLTRHVTPSCLELVKDLDLFDRRKKFVLFLSPEDPQQLMEAVHLGLVNWAAVFDFDRKSAQNGYLKSCDSFLQSIGKPACRKIPKSKDDTTLPDGIPWILLQGLPEMEINVDDNLDLLQEILRLVKKRYPQPVTILVVWKTTNENKKLCRTLRQLLTLVKAIPSWKNSVNLEILSTSEVVDCTLEDIAETWGVKIRNVDLLHFCKAIYSNAMTNPLWRLNPDFSLPKRSYESVKNDITAEALPLSLRWVDSTVEVLYASIGHTPEFGQDDACHFYRGGTISWYGLEMNYAVERESWKPLRQAIEKEIQYPGAFCRRLFHKRGAGGTTSARKLLYDFHLQYPCVCLKAINSQTCLAIKTIREFCSLPVIILADVSHLPGVDNNDIEALYENLSNEKVSCLILEVVHRDHLEETSTTTEPNPKEPSILANTLTNDEREDFFKAYSFYCQTRKSELCKLKSDIQELQIPFYYGLVAFEHEFRGLEPFVSDCLKGLDQAQRNAMCFLSMTHKYAPTIKELPLSAFAGIFGYKPRELRSMEDILPTNCIQLLIEDEEGWRPRHYTIATEVLCQLLTVPYQMHRDNWRRNLAEIAHKFVSCMEEELTNDILINRVSDEKTHKHFSSLVEDIPESDDIVALFEEAIKAHPHNPFFKAHLGRYYSVTGGSDEFDKALQLTDEGILLASEKSPKIRSQLTQMRGIVFKREVRNQVSRNEDLKKIISFAEGGVKSFTRAASISSDKLEDCNIPHVRMIFDVLKHINRTFEGGLLEYMASSDAHRFIVDSFSGISDVLESVSESIYYPDLRQEFSKFGIHGASKRSESKSDLIKHFYKLKQLPKTNTASINRQIVLIHLELCKEKKRPVSEIAGDLMKLLDEALKHDDKIDLTMGLWVKVAPHIPVTLQAADSKIKRWCARAEKSALSRLYRYIFVIIRILEGGRDQLQVDENATREDLHKLVSATSRQNLKHPDRPVVFLGNAKGMGQLVALDRESVKEVRRQRVIPETYTRQLRRLTGIITKMGDNHRHIGLIKANSLTIPFRADLCQPSLLAESNLKRKVCFYLAFNYFGIDAYNVRIVAE